MMKPGPPGSEAHDCGEQENDHPLPKRRAQSNSMKMSGAQKATSRIKWWSLFSKTEKWKQFPVCFFWELRCISCPFYLHFGPFLKQWIFLKVIITIKIKIPSIQLFIYLHGLRDKNESTLHISSVQEHNSGQDGPLGAHHLDLYRLI